jgi:hypothetical protein
VRRLWLFEQNKCSDQKQLKNAQCRLAQEPTNEGPLSFTLFFESPFLSVSTISRSHPSLVSLVLMGNSPRGLSFFGHVCSVADPDPGSGAFLTPGSGMGRKSASGSGIRDEQPGSYLLELRNHFFCFFLGLKYLNSLMRIREPGWRQFGSGIRDGKKSDPG